MLIDFDKSDRFVTTNKNLRDGYIPYEITMILILTNTMTCQTSQ